MRFHVDFDKMSCLTRWLASNTPYSGLLCIPALNVMLEHDMNHDGPQELQTYFERSRHSPPSLWATKRTSNEKNRRSQHHSVLMSVISRRRLKTKESHEVERKMC